MQRKGSTPFWKSASLSGRISSSENEKLVAAGPVSRILSALRRDGHSSGARITPRLQRPTPRVWGAVVARRVGTRPRQGRSFTGGSLPIWSCSVWGLPCPPHYWGGGALLPHLFTLTSALRPRRDGFFG